MLADLAISDRLVRKADGGRRSKVIREIPAELVAVHVYGSSPVGFDEAVQAGIVRLQADGKKVEEFSVLGFGGSVHGGKIEYLVSIRGLVKDVREESKASRYSP